MSHRQNTTRSLLLIFSLLALAVSGHPQVITATRIDQYLGGIHVDNGLKPLVGQGSNFVQRGESYNIDPRLIVAISGAETTFGSHVCSVNNAWNWFWNPNTGCHNSPFDSWDSGINTVSHFLHKNYLLKGYTTIPLIGGRYCASGCEHWVPNVTASYLALGGNPNGPFTLQAESSTVKPPEHPSSPATPTSEPAAEPVITVAVAFANAQGGSASTPNSGPGLSVQATFSNLLKQHINNVELYRDTPQHPEHIAWLTRVPGTADSSPVFHAAFAMPDGVSKDALRVKGQLVQRGKVLSVMISDPIDLPAQPKHAPWLAIGLGVGGLILVLGIIILVLVLRRHKPAAASRAPATEHTKPVAVHEQEHAAVSVNSNSADQPETKTTTLAS